MYFKSYIVCLFTYIDQLLCLATDQLIDVKWGHGTPLSIQSQVGHFYTVPFIEAFGCKVTASILFTARSKEDRIIIGAFILSMGIIRMEMGGRFEWSQGTIPEFLWRALEMDTL